MEIPALDNARYGFTTYTNYLMGLNYLLNKTHENHTSITALLKVVQQRTKYDSKRIKGLLMNSWNSELLLNFPHLLEDDFLKFSNHWAPVQSYYAIYLACRALIVAKGLNANGDHATTLNTLVNFINTEKLFPNPWNILCNTNSFLNLPNNTKPGQINPLENPEHFKSDTNKLLDSLCMFLRTTRQRIIEEKCIRWKEKNPTKKGPRKRLSPGIRKGFEKRERQTSLFDCFYRLRIRSNYKDVDIFILGSSAPEIGLYFKSLCNITDKTLFLVESYLYRYLGKQGMESIVNEYKQTYNLGLLNKLPFSVIKRSKYYA